MGVMGLFAAIALAALSSCTPAHVGHSAERMAPEKRLVVPVDYANPGGPAIELGIVRLPATDPANRLGVLVFAPGGPGDSALEYVKAHEADLARLRERYDIVGMDPRGVGESTPLRCLTGPEMDDYYAAELTPATAHEAAYRYTDGCLANSHGLLAHLGTENVARDLERLRKFLGEEELNYLGFSYGTRVGLSYAEQFPDRVGRMVLDSIDNPHSKPDIDVDEDPPARIGNEDMATEIAGEPLDGLLESLRDNPIRASDGRLVTSSVARAAMLRATLADGDAEQLRQALSRMKTGDANGLQALADEFNGRHPDGSYDQSDDLYISVSCLVGEPAKGIPDRAEARQRVDRLAAAAGEVAPYFGAWLTYREQLCEVWPVAATFAPHDIQAPGAPPMLLLNNSGDQVTTVEDAQAVQESLKQAVLVVNEGTEHGTYLEGYECVDTLVEAFLLDGTLPAEGTRCE